MRNRKNSPVKKMGVAHFFDLANTNAKMNLKSEASKLALSYAWWVLEPALFVILYYFVFQVLLQNGTGPDFIVFLMWGKIPYHWFSKNLSGGSSSIVSKKSMLGSIVIPKVLFPVTVLFANAYKELAVLAVLFLVTFIFGGSLSVYWLYIVPVYLVLTLLSLAAALVGAYLVTFFRDFQNLISIFLMFLMFSSGIFFDVTALGERASELLQIFNPLATLLIMLRKAVIDHEIYRPLHLLFIGLFSLVVFMIMHWVLRRNGSKIAWRVLNT